jgi:hypothetical protein
MRKVLSIAAALLIAAAFVFFFARRTQSNQTAVPMTVIRAIYEQVFARSICSGGSSRPQEINTSTRRVVSLECESNFAVSEVADAHKRRLIEMGYVFVTDSIGRDGIRTIRGCHSDVVVAVNVASLSRKTTVEQRVQWSQKEYEELPVSCRAKRARQ